jgi:O-antigen ligase
MASGNSLGLKDAREAAFIILALIVFCVVSSRTSAAWVLTIIGMVAYSFIAMAIGRRIAHGDAADR